MKTEILGLVATMLLAAPIHDAAAVTISSANPATLNYDLPGVYDLYLDVTTQDPMAQGDMVDFRMYLLGTDPWIGGGFFSQVVGTTFHWDLTNPTSAISGVFSLVFSTNRTLPFDFDVCLRPGSLTAQCAATVPVGVPEPGTLALLGLGLAGLGLSRRRKAH